MATHIYLHDVFGAHETPDGHPEQPKRYAVVDAALRAPEIAELASLHEAPMAALSAAAQVHTADHLEKFQSMAPTEGLAVLDPDTFMGPHSKEAALRGAGGAIAAVDAVMTGKADTAFVAARPPGHHADPDRAMGFCLLNNAAIAVAHARGAHGVTRVAVLDFDVHHGNGTEAAARADADWFFASTHEWPQYPGTGRATERGDHGQIINMPMLPGTSSYDFQRAWGEGILPRLQAFAPELVVISAGFDAHRADPLGGFDLTEADFAWVTSAIGAVARETSGGKVVSVLEGGYDLNALASSAAAHVKALANPGGGG